MNPEQLAAAVAALRNLVRVVEASIPAASPGRRNVVNAAAEAIRAMNARNAQGAFLAAGRAATSASNWVRQTGSLPRSVIEEQWGQSITPEELAAMRRDVDEAARALRTSLDALVTTSARSSPRSTPAPVSLPSDVVAQAIRQLATRATALAAPESVMAAIAELATVAATSSAPDDVMRNRIEAVWSMLRAARPEVQAQTRRVILAGDRRSRIGDDPPIVNPSWGWFHSPSDIETARVEITAAWRSLTEAVNAIPEARRTQAQRDVIARMNDAKRLWATTSNDLASSWWSRAMPSATNRIEDGAAKYAEIRRDLAAVGINVNRAARAESLPSRAPTETPTPPGQSWADRFGALLSNPTLLIGVGLAAYFLLSRNKR